MAMTRANLETLIVKRLGALMEAAGLAVTIAGSNADLSDPLAWACRNVGGSTANVSTVTDSELASIPIASYDDTIDLAEYRTLKNLIGNLDDVDITTGPRAEKLSQLADQARAMLASMEDDIHEIFRAPTVGYINLNFSEHGEAHL